MPKPRAASPGRGGPDPAAAARAPGVRDIARATQLSIATVSRVISGGAQVAPQTRQRVLDAVNRLGYLPNPAARALSTRRSRTIGAIIPTLAHSIFANFLNAIERELAGHGYGLVVAATGGDVTREAERARGLLDLGAEGLIVSGLARDPAFERFVVERGLPVVATSVFDAKNPLPTIGYDNAALAGMALGHLRQLGHRSVAVLHGPTRNNDRTVLRLRGVHRAAQGLALRTIETSLDAVGGALGAREALALRPRPTALLCLSDVLALGALFEARRAGVEVPTQLSVMGFDDLDWAGICEPPLTTLHLPTEAMGRHAAQALVLRLDKGTPIVGLCLAAELVLRASTAAPSRRGVRPDRGAARAGH
jgi:LacI family transcriptional regulator